MGRKSYVVAIVSGDSTFNDLEISSSSAKLVSFEPPPPRGDRGAPAENPARSIPAEGPGAGSPGPGNGAALLVQRPIRWSENRGGSGESGPAPRV